MRDRFSGGMPQTGISHGKADKPARPRVGMPLQPGSPIVTEFGADSQFPSFRHGVASIDSEVHKDLAQHIFIAWMIAHRVSK